MNPELEAYVAKAREHGKTTAEIKHALVTAGWQEAMVAAALKEDDNLVPPPPPPTAAPMANPYASTQPPMGVVRIFTTRGLEYAIMFLSLGISALGFAAVLNNSVDQTFNNGGSSDLVSMAAAALIVALPIFLVLFLRLKKAEQVEPQIKFDPSRKRAVQLTLLITFLIGIGHFIEYIYTLLNGSVGDIYSAPHSAGADLLHLLVTLVVAGGIFAYYWMDEHKVK